MEPASLVGLVSATASLSVLTARVAMDIHNLLDKYNNVETVLHSIEKECTMLGVAFRKINQWLDSNRHRSADVYEDMRVCLAYFEESLNSIQTEISTDLEVSVVPKAKFGVKRKVKFLWNEDILKSHLETVRERRSALSFVIQAFELTTPMDTRRQIRQVAKATSIRFARPRDDQSFISQESTGYEEVLANSGAYLRTRYKAKLPFYNLVGLMKDRNSNYVRKENLPHLSIGTTILVVSDYMARRHGHLDIAKGDFVKILEKRNGPFWLGEAHGRTGQFPIGSCDTSVALIGPKLEKKSSPPSTKPSDYTAGAMSCFIFFLMVTWLIHSCIGFFREHSRSLSPLTSGLTSPHPVYTDVEDPLLAAAAAGSIEIVSELIDSYTHDPTEGALLAAAAFGSFKKTSELLEQGIKPSVRDSKLRTPLHFAAANGNNETIALLLKYKTGWFADDNITPLHLAARYGHTSAVLQITRTSGHDGSRERATFPQATRKLQVSAGMAFGQQLANFFAKKTFSARELAAIFGHGNTALAFPNSQSDYLQAFSCASMLGDAQLVEALWNHHTQLWWHQRYGSLGKAVRWFPAPPLHLAVMSGNRATVAFLLEQGMDPNDQSSRSINRWMTDAFPAYSATAHYAAMLGSTGLLLTLKQRGADLAALDHRSRTPLSYAVENLNTEAVEFLVKQKHRKKRYLGSGHRWQDKKRKVDGVPDKRIRDALRSLGSNI